MKVHKGKLTSYLDFERGEVCTSDLRGSFDGGFTVMSIDNLNENVKGKDLVFDVMLRELTKHKDLLKEGKEVTVNLEWTISDDYSKYLTANVTGVEVE